MVSAIAMLPQLTIVKCGMAGRTEVNPTAALKGHLSPITVTSRCDPLHWHRRNCEPKICL